MKKKHEHIIESVRPGSIAEELGIEPGDVLLEIDGQVIEDIFDYQFYVESEELLVVEHSHNAHRNVAHKFGRTVRAGFEYGFHIKVCFAKSQYA